MAGTTSDLGSKHAQSLLRGFVLLDVEVAVILHEVMADRPFVYRTQVSVTSKAPPAEVFDVITRLRNHLTWSGDMAADEQFKLLTLDASSDRAEVGTTFTSTGVNFNGTFRDCSVVTEVVHPSRLAIETDARLERKRGKTWHVHFEHRYDVAPEGDGSRITYTETVQRVNYVPYWLRAWARPIFKPLVNRADTSQLRNLARLAEERLGA